MGRLGEMHMVCLWLSGKHIIDFLLVIIELFLLAFTAEALLSEICQNRHFLNGFVTLSTYVK